MCDAFRGDVSFDAFPSEDKIHGILLADINGLSIHIYHWKKLLLRALLPYVLFLSTPKYTSSFYLSTNWLSFTLISQGTYHIYQHPLPPSQHFSLCRLLRYKRVMMHKSERPWRMFDFTLSVMALCQQVPCTSNKTSYMLLQYIVWADITVDSTCLHELKLSGLFGRNRHRKKFSHTMLDEWEKLS